MLIKLIILSLLAIVVVSLASAGVYLIRDTDGSRRVAKALTLRIALSLLVFILMMLAFAVGLITPHGVMPG